MASRRARAQCGIARNVAQKCPGRYESALLEVRVRRKPLLFLFILKIQGCRSTAMSEVRYPVSSTFKVLDGYDIYRSNNLIVALVVVDGQFGRDLRLYRWMKRNEQWKVDLCRMG